MTVRRWVPALLLVSLLIVATARAQIAIGPRTTVRFATRTEAADILGRNDDFVQRFSSFDLAARLKGTSDVSVQAYLQFVRANARGWDEGETRKVTAAVEGVQERLRSMALPFPSEVLFIKTTGLEEGNAAYTRSNAIIVPPAEVGVSPAQLRHLVAHELFHVLTRANPQLRDKLYAAIGFERCGEVTLPPPIASRKITNPDAPTNDHCIRVEIDDKEVWAIPIIFSKSAYDAARGGEFFTYLQFQLLIVERTGAQVRPAYAGGQPRLVDPEKVSGFFEQVGRNTSYIIHPEEILADNFAMLVLGQQDQAKSPQVIEKIRAILDASR